jgi:ribokinase
MKLACNRMLRGMPILCYGSLNPDLVHFVDRLPTPGDDLRSAHFAVTFGGGAANAAVCLAQWEGSARLAGNSLGADPLADWLLADLGRRGVDTALVARDETSGTPHTIVMITPDGERTIVGSGYGGVSWIDVPEDELRRSDAVLVDGYSGEAGWNVLARAAGLGLPAIGMDVAPDGASNAGLIVWSKHEHRPEEATGLASTGTTVVLTDGPRPVTILEGSRRWTVAPPVIESRNVVGAGDAFAAMCALGSARNWDPEHTIAMATAAGTLAAAAEREDSPPDLTAIEELAESLLTDRLGG